MDELVEVMDLTMVTTTPGVTLQYTVRPHEGDALVESGDDLFRIQFGPREVLVGNERRTVAGKRVVIHSDKLVEVSTVVRLEPKVRPSAKALANREQAELDKLKAQHGVADSIVIPFRKPSNVTGE